MYLFLQINFQKDQQILKIKIYEILNWSLF